MSAALAAWALVAALFSAVATWRVHGARRRQRQAARDAPVWPPVLLLRPLDAPTPQELANLAAPVGYPGPLRHVAVCPYRPALPPGVEWLPSDPLCPNRKVGHLLYALATLEREGWTVLAVDADVRVDGALVRGLVAPLGEGAALTTAAPFAERGPGAAQAAVHGLLTQTHHSFEALHAMSAGAKAVCGKALGFSAQALAELPELAQHIGEDLELAVRLHRRGLGVALSPAPARVPPPPAERLEDALLRFTRWMQVLRAHRPALAPTVPPLFCPTPLLLVGAVLAPSGPLLAALGALVLARALLARKLCGRWALGWLWGEALLCAAFLSSVVRREVRWRGRTFRLEAGGRMVGVWR